jgi:hypothetical protein
MSRSEYRNGIAPLRTIEELSLVLPIVILFIVDGVAQARFPNSERGSPSPFVSVVLVREGENPPSRIFPLFFHWKQWDKLVVPLLKEAQINSWRGGLPSSGDLIRLLENITGPCGEIIFPAGEVFGSSPGTSESVGRLYGCDPSDLDRVGGKTLQYLLEIRGKVLSLRTGASNG